MISPPGNQHERLTRIETELRALDERLRSETNRDAAGGTPRQVWVAVTTTKDGVYPEPGANKYPIIFAEPSFNDAAAGNEAVALVNGDNEWQTIAAQIGDPGGYLTQGTPVFVVEVDRKYFILAAVNESSDQNQIRFELIEPLNLGGQAQARAVVWNGAAYAMFGDPFAIYDSRPEGYFAGFATPGGGLPGYQGMARFTDRQAFEVLAMDRAARFVNFRLTAGKDFLVEAGGENWCRDVATDYQFDGRAQAIVDLHDRSRQFLGVRGGAFVFESFSGAAPSVRGIAVFDDAASTFGVDALGAQNNLVYQPLSLNLPRLYAFQLQENMGATVADQAAAAILDLHTQAFIRNDLVYDRVGAIGARAFADFKSGRLGVCELQGGRFYALQAPCNALEEIAP